MQRVEKRITPAIFDVLTVERSVASRKSFGGTAPANVARAAATARRRFLRKRHENVFTSPSRKRGSQRCSSRSIPAFGGNDGWKNRVDASASCCVAITLAGCGKKGPPGPPPGVPNTYPQNYPAAVTSKKTQPWAPEIAYRDGALSIEAIPLARIAEEVGTPFYVYSAAQIARRYREFAGGFGDMPAVDLLFGKGQSESRRDRAARPARRWRRCRLGRRVPPRAGRRHSRQAHHLLGRRQDRERVGIRARARRPSDQCRIAARARGAERGRDSAWAASRRSPFASIPMSMRAPMRRSRPARRKTNSASTSPMRRHLSPRAQLARHHAGRDRRSYRLAADEAPALRARLPPHRRALSPAARRGRAAGAPRSRRRYRHPLSRRGAAGDRGLYGAW